MSGYIIQFGIKRGYPNRWIIAYLSLTTKFMRGYPHRDVSSYDDAHRSKRVLAVNYIRFL